MTEEDKALLRQYEGAGGLGEDDATTHGTLYEFYTPKTVIQKIWGLASKWLGEKRSLDVLEPSAGTGRFGFLSDRQDMKIDMVEIDDVSARIAKILNPDATVKKGAFQELFTKNGAIQKQYAGKKYDLVIGNPPYGEYTGIWKGRGEGKDHKRYEEYFMDRGLDTLKDGGVMAFIVPSGFMRNYSNSEVKQKLAAKGKLVEAYRLPNGTFGTTGIGTDILIIRKEKGDVNDFYADGYFAKHPEHVLGEETTRTGKWGPEKYVGLPAGKTFDEVMAGIDLTKVDAAPAGNKPLSEQQKEAISIALEGNKNAEKLFKKEPKAKTGGGGGTDEPQAGTKEVHSLEEFNQKYNRRMEAHEVEVFAATDIYGHIDMAKLSPEAAKKFQTSDQFCMMDGQVYHASLYASGNIYERLDQLEKDRENIPAGTYKRQKALLESVLPEKKTTKNITISPISEFAQKFSFSDEGNATLINKFWEWCGVSRGNTNYQNFNGNVTQHDIPGVISWTDIVDYIKGDQVRANKVSSYLSGKAKEDQQDKNKAEAALKREKRREAAERLFKRFIETGLESEEQKKLEDHYNYTFNSNVSPDYTKIPVFVDGLSKSFKGKELSVKDIQLKGVAFLNTKGNGLLAYDVGVGKTLTGIMATVQQLQSGRCKKPMVVVPKATYKNWLKEIRDLVPDIKINELGNMGDAYTKKFKNADGTIDIPEGALNVMSYEGLENITFTDETIEGTLLADMMDSQKVADEDQSKESKREQQLQTERIKEILGKASGVRSEAFFMENLGFDHITIDEAHNFKNVFGRAKTPTQKTEKGDDKKGVNEFNDLQGGTSNRAAKMFGITQYIQSQNNGRNVFALTATPFTNSPIEIYNVLSLVARQKLKDLGIYNMHEFLAHFALLKSEWSVTTKGTIEKKSVMKEFKNLPALQNLIREYIDKVDGEEAGVVRPNKTIHIVELPQSAAQKQLIDAEQLRFASVSKDNPGAALVAINNMRQSTVSMDLVKRDPKFHENVDFSGDPISDSPKLNFSFGCVREIYSKRPDVGQVLYMPTGKNHFPEYIDYLVKAGIPKDAISIISADVSLDKREKIMEDFNNPDGKIKIVLGTESIQEGVNLNGNSAVMYNLLLGWNPSERHQVEGRVWRQGNLQENVHIVYPQIVDSVDSAMYQKHDEKSKRFGEVWKYKGDSLNVEAISAEDLKFSLIKDPEKRAKFAIDLEVEKIDNEKRELRIQIDVLNKHKDDHASAAQEIKEITGETIPYIEKSVANAKEGLEAAKAKLATMTKPAKGERDYSYERVEYEVQSAEGNVSHYKEKLKWAEYELKKEKAKIEKIEAKLQSLGNISLKTIPHEVERLERDVAALDVQAKKIHEDRPRYVEEARKQIQASQKEVPPVHETIKKEAESILASLKYKQIEKAFILQVGDKLIKAEIKRIPTRDESKYIRANGRLYKIVR